MHNHPTISIDEVSLKFQTHLNLRGNSRIIFSGKYGTGKTRFLKLFFEKRNADYNIISISPAKYVVSGNEDIFELIKVDIVLQLFQNGYLTLNPKNNNEFKTVSKAFFLNQQPSHFLKFVAKVASKIDLPSSIANSVKNVSAEFILEFIELQKRYKEYVAQIENDLELKEEKLEGFIETFATGSGNIFELNFITTTIQETLAAIKTNKKKNKENVLIIDDLDRIDPEHIFRILNILSAHNDYWGSENKFGFDKIILVCDIDNIKKIYDYRYGNVDFDGYIDKFYTTDYFRFDNRDAIKTFLANKPELGITMDEINFLSAFLNIFLDRRMLTLRQIIKSFSAFKIDDFIFEEIDLKELNFRGKQSPYVDYGKIYFHSSNIHFLRTLRLLISVFGDLQLFREAVREMRKFSAETDAQLNDTSVALLAIPYHLSTRDDHAKCFAIATDNNSNTLDFESCRINITRYPEINILGHIYRISLAWNIHNPYKGNGCFLKDAKILKLGVTQPNIRSGGMMNMILTILQYFENRGALSKMGVGANF